MTKALPLFAAPFLVLAAALMAAPSVPAFAATQDATAGQVSVTEGKMLYLAGGKKLAAVYRVDADGSPMVILNGKMVTVPVTTLSVDGDKVVTSLSMKELRSAR